MCVYILHIFYKSNNSSAVQTKAAEQQQLKEYQRLKQ
jgi:phage-related protein